MLSLLLFAAAVAAQCTLPNTPLSSTIAEPFGIQVQNPAFPEIHNRYLYLWEAGGGDKHLYLNPAGVPATTLTLDAGVLELGPLFAVINGEYTTWDNTTKLFTTQRGDPRAIIEPTHACNPDTAAPQIELAFTGRQTSPPGGHICVRLASGNRHEFRYSPPQNPAHDPSLSADERSEWSVFIRALRVDFGEREDLRHAFAVRFDEIWRIRNHLIEEKAEFAGRSVNGSALCFHPSLDGQRRTDWDELGRWVTAPEANVNVQVQESYRVLIQDIEALTSGAKYIKALIPAIVNIVYKKLLQE
ncbi:hypothetical protein HYQ44_020313 [Verticillium longisporum]|nr:hypothetical protein HYQ44_020313 [Verticillium longisporum]